MNNASSGGRDLAKSVYMGHDIVPPLFLFLSSDLELFWSQVL